MSDPRNHNRTADELFRNRIAAAMRQLNAVESDADIEAALDAVDVEPISDAAIQRILGHVKSSITTTLHDAPIAVGLNRLHRDASRTKPDRYRKSSSKGSISIVIACLALVFLVAVTFRQFNNQSTNSMTARNGDQTAPLSKQLIAATDPSSDDRSLAADPLVRLGQTITTGPREKRRVTLPDGSILSMNELTTVTITGPRRVKLQAGELFIEVIPADQIAGNRSAAPAERFVVETAKRQVTALGTKFDVKADGMTTTVNVTQGKVQVSGVEEVVEAGFELVADAVGSASTELHPARRSAYVVEWVKDLVAAAGTVIVPTSEHAGGTITVVDPQGQEMKLSLRKFHIDVHIENGFARTTIDQTYFNHTWQQLEGTFRFPLPADASLSRLAMYVNGTLMEGGMVERDYGRNVFEQIRYTRRDPALLEWVDGSTFQMRVFPLEARQEKRILLSYTQRLPNDYGKSVYRFPGGHNLEAVRDWSAHFRVKDGARTKWYSPSHLLDGHSDNHDLIIDGHEEFAVLDRDLVLELIDQTQPASLNSEPVWSSYEQEGFKYVMLRMRPEWKAIATKSPRHWIFLVENSADRNSILAETQRQIAKVMLENLEHVDTFSVIRAGTQPDLFEDQPVDCSLKNIAAALEFLKAVAPIGALDLEQALQALQRQSAPNRETWMVHLGTGIPVLGERDHTTLIRQLPAKAHYVGVAVGKRWSKAFMETAASRTDGHVVQVNPDESVAWRAFDLLSTLNAPRLTDISISADTEKQSAGATPQFLGFANSVSHGQQYAAVTRWPIGQSSPKSLRIRGKLNGQPYSQTISIPEFPQTHFAELSTGPTVISRSGHLPRTWARLEIDRLVALGDTENKVPIIELSKSMYVMSPFTSLLVLENDAMYEQFKVDRGRKDHWAMYDAPAVIPMMAEQAPLQLSLLDAAKERLKVAESRAKLAEQNHRRCVAEKRSESDRKRMERLKNVELRDVQLLTEEVQRIEQANRETSDPVYKAWQSVISRRLVAQFHQPTEFVRRTYLNYWGDHFTSNGLGIDQDDVLPLFARSKLNSTRQTLPSAYFLDDDVQYFPVSGDVKLTKQILAKFRYDQNQIENRLKGLSPAEVNRKIASLEVPVDWLKDQIDNLEQLTFPTEWDMSQPVGSGFGGHRSFGGIAVSSSGGGMPNSSRGFGINGHFGLPNDWYLYSEGVPQARLGWHSSLLPLEIDGFQPLYDSNGNGFVEDFESAREVARFRRPVRLQGGGRSTIRSERIERIYDESAQPPFEVFGITTKADAELRLNSSLDFYAEVLVANVARRRDVAIGGASHFDAIHPQLIGVLQDLPSHAPGLQTWNADRLAVADQASTDRPVRGTVDFESRRLIEKSRSLGWEQVKYIPSADSGHVMTDHEVIAVDGAGRLRIDRLVSEGLKETVINDGSTLWHLYPEIGLGAKRTISRFHQSIICSLVPWYVPAVEDLCMNADLTSVAERTIRVMALNQATDATGFAIELEFETGGRLHELRLINLPSGKACLTQSVADDGTVRVLDADGKVLAQAQYERRTIDAPTLVPTKSDLVVLPLPYRSSASTTVSVPVNLQTNAPDYAKLSDDDALSLLATYFAEARPAEMATLIDQRFTGRSDQRVGLVVLMASVYPQHALVANAAGQHQGSALAKFLEQVASWSTNGQWTGNFSLGLDASPFVKRISEGLNHFNRWSAESAVLRERSGTEIEHDLTATLRYVRDCRSLDFAARLLSTAHEALKQGDRMNATAASQLNMTAAAIAVGRNLPAFARQTRIEWLLSIGDEESTAAATALFREHLADAIDKGIFPELRSEVRTAFCKRFKIPQNQTCKVWADLVKAAAQKLADENSSLSLIAMARRCVTLNETGLAGEIIQMGIKDQDLNAKAHLNRMALKYATEVEDWVMAEACIQRALSQPESQRVSSLWREASEIAYHGNKFRVWIEFLEKAYELEFAALPKTVNLEQFRQDYDVLFKQLEQRCEQLADGNREEKESFSRIVQRAAQRWRKIDTDSTTACHRTAKMLTKLGQTTAAWNYWTTPLAAVPDQSATWTAFAVAMDAEHRFTIADKAWSTAFECEPANPQILLQHAQFLRSTKQEVRAKELLMKVATSQWQPRFEGIKAEANALLSGQ